MSENGRWMKAIELDKFLHVDGPGSRVRGDHVSEFILVQRVELVAYSDRTFLRGIVVLIDGSAFPGTHLRHPLPQ